MTMQMEKLDLSELKPKIAVIGVGGAGGNAVNNMISAKLHGVSFIVANTDAQALAHSNAKTKIQLGVTMTEGLGAGSKPEIGAAAAEESVEELRSHMRGLHMVFITAGMGGGTGTGAAPVIAAIAREEGVLAVGVVTKPFHFEGQRRMRSAEFGIELLAEQVDTLIVIPNQNLFRVAVMKTTFSEAFALADQVLHDGIACITDVMVKDGIINLDFADVNLIMRGRGQAMMGTGDATGENRGRDAAEAAITNPLLDDVSLHGARGLLVSIIGGRNDLTLYEVDEAANRVREEVAPDANIIIGTAFDETLNGAIRVSVVATALDENEQGIVPNAEQAETRARASRALAEEDSLPNRLEQVEASASNGSPPRQDAAIVGRQIQRDSEPSSPAVPRPKDYPEDHNGPSSVRMPETSDFSPVGQALLQERQRGSEGENRGAEELHEQRAGFFKRLADRTIGRGSNETLRQSVAHETQNKSHSSLSETGMDHAFLDPHAKGGALSSSSLSAPENSELGSELSEFPSFLRGRG